MPSVVVTCTGWVAERPGGSVPRERGFPGAGAGAEKGRGESRSAGVHCCSLSRVRMCHAPLC